MTGLPNVILPAVSGLKVSSTPPRVRFLTIYVKMLIGQLVLFVNEAFCINQLTVGPGQELLRTAMEISSKTSSKPRKSWIWKLMVKLEALYGVLERAGIFVKNISFVCQLVGDVMCDVTRQSYNHNQINIKFAQIHLSPTHSCQVQEMSSCHLVVDCTII